MLYCPTCATASYRTAPFANGAPIQNYIIQMRRTEGPWRNAGLAGSFTTAWLVGLEVRESRLRCCTAPAALHTLHCCCCCEPSPVQGTSFAFLAGIKLASALRPHLLSLCSLLQTVCHCFVSCTGGNRLHHCTHCCCHLRAVPHQPNPPFVSCIDANACTIRWVWPEEFNMGEEVHTFYIQVRGEEQATFTGSPVSPSSCSACLACRLHCVVVVLPCNAMLRCRS